MAPGPSGSLAERVPRAAAHVPPREWADPKEGSRHRLKPLEPTASLREGHRTEGHAASHQEDAAAQPRRREADGAPSRSPQPAGLEEGVGGTKVSCRQGLRTATLQAAVTAAPVCE